MSTTPAPVPVILVAFPKAPPEVGGDPAPTNWRDELYRRTLDVQVLPMVALLPDSDTPLPSLDNNPYHQEWFSVVTNSGNKNQVLFRANAVDILTTHSNILPVAVLEFDHQYEAAWDLPRMQQ